MIEKFGALVFISFFIDRIRQIKLIRPILMSILIGQPCRLSIYHSYFCLLINMVDSVVYIYVLIHSSISILLIQTYYGPRVALPTYYNSAVASGHAPHPYMWGPPQVFPKVSKQLKTFCLKGLKLCILYFYHFCLMPRITSIYSQ